MRKNWIELHRDRNTGIETVHASFSGHAFDPHTHDEWLIGVTLKGVQQFICNKTLHTSTQGSAILLEPGALHDGHAPRGLDFTYVMLSLPQTWLCDMVAHRPHALWKKPSFSFREKLIQNERLNKNIVNVFKSINRANNRLSIDQSLEFLFDVLFKDTVVFARSTKNNCSHHLLRARDYIHDFLETDIALDDLAFISGIDRFRLTRQFSHHFGISPHAYLIRTRLCAAKKMLAKGIRPTEVATRTGFSDQSHMGRWFKRAYRLTPLAYQKSCTNLLYSADKIEDESLDI